MYELKNIYRISHAEIRNILLNQNKMKNIKLLFYLLKEMSPQNMIWKKIYLTIKIQYTSTDSVLLYEDEKGPITAKTYGGSSWSSVQVKVEKTQKINDGLLKNVFGERMITQMIRCMYKAIKRKQGNSLLIF